MAIVLRTATGRERGPVSEVQIACYFSDAVWTHHVKPVAGREPAPELRRAYDGLEAAWREALLRVRDRILGERPPYETALARAARLYRAARPRLEEAARKADAALAAAEARRAEWSRRALEPAAPIELSRRRQIGNAAALLARQLRLYRSWVDAAFPPPSRAA